jgi:hypothetical protein
MRRRLILKPPSPALVISCLALFIALGSAGYSATGGNFILGQPNSAGATTSLTSGVSTAQTLIVENTAGKAAAKFITNGSAPPFGITSGSKVGNLNADKLDDLNSTAFVQTADTAGGDLTGPFGNLQLAAGSVTEAEVLDDTAIGGGLRAEDLAPNSVGTSEIQTDGVQATEIANDSIDSGEIVDFGLSNQDVGVLFAQVNGDGTVFSSSGGVTAIRLGTGTYEVDFGRNITACAFISTQGEGGVGGAGGGITGVTDRSGNSEAVFATVRTNANALVDRAFQLVVVC